MKITIATMWWMKVTISTLIYLFNYIMFAEIAFVGVGIEKNQRGAPAPHPPLLCKAVGPEQERAPGRIISDGYP